MRVQGRCIAVRGKIFGPKLKGGSGVSGAGRHKGGVRRALLGAAVIITLLFNSWPHLPVNIISLAYASFRELFKWRSIISTWQMEKITSEHFYVKYRRGAEETAALVLEAAECFYPVLAEEFGFSCRRKIPVILYSSRAELNGAYGWGNGESAMGVYWAGTIGVLDPRLWLGQDTAECDVRENFLASGPLAHEITHLMVDYITAGNCPRWLNEGIAQYYEYALTGYELASLDSSISSIYTLQELEAGFDDLPDWELAYWQSLDIVKYLAGRFGQDSLIRLLGEMGRGKAFAHALKSVYGISEEELELGWRTEICAARLKSQP